jgi:hypothetical protein
MLRKPVDLACPGCGIAGMMYVTLRMVAMPGSLAGSTPKVAAREVPYLVCNCCTWELAGRTEGDEAVFIKP